MAKFGEAFVRFGIPGCPDILGLIAPGGRWLGIEVKSPTGVQTDDQKVWQDVITRFGGLYILAREMADVDVMLNSL